MSVEVQQSDRNAAHDIYDGLEMFGLAEAAAQGLLDNGAMVKAIVNVRHQAEEAMRERCAEIAERYPSNESYVVPIVRGVAHAIRSIDTRGE